MILEVGQVYVVFLVQGKRFAAKLLEIDDKYAVFESSNGVQSQHPIHDIFSVRKVQDAK